MMKSITDLHGNSPAARACVCARQRNSHAMTRVAEIRADVAVGSGARENLAGPNLPAGLVGVGTRQSPAEAGLLGEDGVVALSASPGSSGQGYGRTIRGARARRVGDH